MMVGPWHGRDQPSKQREAASPRSVTARAAMASFDDLVGAHEDRLWDRQPERLRGLEIDDQLEGGRLLDRQVGGLGALEDLSRVNAGLAIDSRKAGSIADQAADRGELATLIDRRNGMAC